MLKDNIIPRDFYLRIKNIKVPRTDMLSYEKDGLDLYKNHKYRTFIYCLSRKQDNTVLLNEKNKYCIELLLSMQCLSRDQIQKPSKIEPYSVIYGNDAIEYIKEKIMVLYKNKSIMPVIESFIEDLLNDLKFVLKDEQYRDEEEVRIVLRIKKDKIKSSIRYYDVVYPKYVVRQIYKYSINKENITDLLRIMQDSSAKII